MSEDTTPTEPHPAAHIIKAGDILAGDIESLLRASTKVSGLVQSLAPDAWDAEKYPEIQKDWQIAAECMRRVLWQFKAARQALLNHGAPVEETTKEHVE